uniref:Uncharacterized protein n=1 Tax=Minutocellus polymorphus TaxID=265543 RepID=A0A7S0ADK0_9STRA|mmetsp:Transcript_11125/g.18538  ORF Transcript_11125/g.18538 Transcript_11125/m.18538 type:complete len:248 (+) Transcript_11125:96-839(+)
MFAVRKSKRIRTEKPSLSILQQDIISFSDKCSRSKMENVICRIRLATKKEIEDLKGWSPLVRAVFMFGGSTSHPNTWQALLIELIEVCHKKGISLDAGDRCLSTGGILERPLVLAAHYGYHPVVKKLLLLGASPDVMNGEGKTALHTALENRNSIRRLRDNDRATFRTIAAASCITTSFGVYRSSAPGSMLYINGDEVVFGTPMLRAIRFHNDDAFRILVEFGAFLSDRDFLLLYKKKLLRRFGKMI